SESRVGVLLLLTIRAEVSGAASDFFLFDRTPTNAALRSASVSRDQELSGEFLFGCCSNRSSKNAASLAMNALDFIFGQGRSDAIGSHLRAEKNFVGIDVSDSGDHSLVH